MSKVKLSHEPHYELLYIIPNRYTEDETKPIAEKVAKLIEDNKGKITLREEWGKKKLAYAVKGNAYGYYNLLEFDADTGTIAKINRDLALMSEILRHQLVAKAIRTAAEIKEEKMRMERRLEEAIAKTKVEEVKEPEKARPKMDLKDLDEKLDKILETDDLL